MLTSLYIHIPFCDHICTYCDFHKELATNKKKQRYVDAVCKELIYRQKDLVNITTIYIGGGTPLSLELPQLEQLLGVVKMVVPMANVVEFTIETNPNNLTETVIQSIRNFGVNRVSIGVQTFNEKQLAFLGRDHSLEDVANTIRLLKLLHFPNISVDMMFSLVNQTLEELYYDIEQVLQLDVDHISYYSLILEEKTKLYYLLNKGEITMNSEELEGQMYDVVIDQLTQHGFHQYEISNFAKDNYESMHNKTYWQFREYLGIGSGAHSFINHTRLFHEPNVSQYMTQMEEDQYTVYNSYNDDGIGDELMMGLRLTQGVNIESIEQKYQLNLLDRYPEIHQHIKDGLLEQKNGYLLLTRKGILLGNIVFATFVEVE